MVATLTLARLRVSPEVMGERRQPQLGDEALLASALEGRRGMQQLAGRLGPFIRARVLRMTRSEPARADDLMQEVWAHLLAEDARALRAWNPARASLPGYVNLLCSRVVAKSFRAEGAQKRRPRGGLTLLEGGTHPTGTPAPDRVAQDRERLDALWTHLQASLGPMGRLVLSMLFVDNRPPKEIAAALGLSVATVNGWRHKIKLAARAFEEGT